jgi:hypothetical protein
MSYLHYLRLFAYIGLHHIVCVCVCVCVCVFLRLVYPMFMIVQTTDIVYAYILR